MALPRSTNLLIAAFVMGLPFLWLQSPLEELGQVGFYSLAAAMLTCGLGGIACWAIDRN
ncbi:hypothetical protein L3X17_19495 [Pseudomonas stutzeri]|nr:hypothetical protein [Stutzerimonas stutzeri]